MCYPWSDEACIDGAATLCDLASKKVERLERKTGRRVNTTCVVGRRQRAKTLAKLQRPIGPLIRDLERTFCPGELGVLLQQ